MMRISRLNLELFGHFEDKGFHFSRPNGGETDFHIVYGPNEAGKTTTMEGYLRLLYGFEARDKYAFRHERKNLRVSGVLEIDGQEHFFRRLPTRENNLVDENNAPLPETAISRVMAGLSDKDYKKLLCLDDDTIEMGGEEIVNSKGDVGRLLFSAAAGLPDLSEILGGANEEARELYLKSGRTSQYHQLKQRLGAIDTEIANIDMSANALKQLNDALHAANARVAETKQEFDDLTRQHHELVALIQALPKMATLQELVGKVSELSHYPEQVSIDGETLQKLLSEHTELTTRQSLAEDQRLKLKEPLEGLILVPGALELADRMKALEKSRSRHETAKLDLPRREIELTELDAKIMAQLEILSPGATLSVDALNLGDDLLDKLQELSDNSARTAQAIETETTEIKSADERCTKLAAKLERARKELPDQSPLAKLFDTTDMDGLAEKHASAQSAIGGAEKRLRTQLAELKLAGQGFDSVPVAPMTVIEAEALIREIKEARHSQEQVEETLSALGAEQEKIALSIENLCTGSTLKTPEEAQHAREERNAAWQELRHGYSDQKADQFETLMARVDAIADAQILGAEEVGQIRQLKASAIEKQVQQKEQNRLYTKGCEKLQSAKDRLEKAAIKAGLATPVEPDVFIDWLRKLELAQKAEDELNWAKQDHGDTLQAASSLAEKLAELLSWPNGTFEELAKKARVAIADYREQLSLIEADQSNLAQFKQDRIEREAKLKNLQGQQKELEAARDHVLSEHLNALLKISTDGGKVLAHLSTLRKLAEYQRARIELGERINSMRRDQQQFVDGLRPLAENFGVELHDDPLESYDQLQEQARQAKQAAAEHERLTKALEENTQQIEDIDTRLKIITSQQQQIAAQFDPSIPTDTLNDLQTSVIRANEVIAWREQIADLKQEICQMLKVDDLDSATDKASATNLSELKTQVSSLEPELENARALYEEALRQQGAVKNEIGSIKGDDQVAILNQEKKTIELEMREVLLKHLELTIGRRLAEEAIIRYRERHRSDMLAATEAAFKELTSGAYSSLKILSEGSSSILVAIDSADGKAKQAADLSKGTRFQLYLALRAAAHDQMVNNGVCLPFLCDDIFETFDEERTATACRLMERVGRKGQAIYFTHHRHVAEIAQEICGNKVQLHEI